MQIRTSLSPLLRCFLVVAVLFIVLPSHSQGQFIERGLCEVIVDGFNTGKLLGLHKRLSPGTEIVVKNPANGLTVIVKIIGPLPETGSNTDLVLKLSQAAFKKLRASGKRFSVELYKPSPMKRITHNVEEGETLYAISKKYNVQVEDIKKWNRLEDNLIADGQALTIYLKPN